MIKNERDCLYHKEGNNNNKKININNNRYNNIKSNSPNLSHQNNYYYNTKINHLILQGPSTINRSTNNQHQQHPLCNSVYINYDFLDKNQNNESNTFKTKELNHSLNKNIIDISNTNRNMLKRYSKSFLDNAHNNISIHKKYESNNKYNKNNYNPFQVLNYLKKRKHPSNNIYYLVNKDIPSDNNYETNLSNSHLSKSGIFKTNNSTYIDGLSLSNNKHYFYNMQNNKNNKSSIKIEVNNNTKGYQKIPVKSEKVGNYSIKSPGMINSKKNINKFSKINNKINITKKGVCKSPEIIGKNKTKYIPLKNVNNIGINNFSKVYNSEMEFYKKNNEAKTRSSININNIRKKKNVLNNNKKNVNSINNNININSVKKKNNNNIINNYIGQNNIDEISIKSSEKKNNLQKDIYIKINPKNYRLIDNTKNNNGNESPKINREKKMNNVTNFKNYIKYQILEFNVKNNIELFCDILEQFYYNSFKNFYNFFIQKLISFAQQKASKRAIVLRRLKDGKKDNISNNIINNNSRINPNKSINKEINVQRNNDKSPSKFVELKKNIMPSMMKINQDNYIELFNEIFKKQEEDIENKKCRSPIIEKRKVGNIKILEDSLDLEYNDDKKYDKYQTNTNVFSVYYPKKSNLHLKLNVDLINKNHTTKNNIAFDRDSFRGSLSTDNKKALLKNSNIKAKKYINNNYISKNITNTDNNSIKKKYEYDTENKRIEPIENTVYYDTKIFQNQKYQITNSPEPYLKRENSDKKIFNKMEQMQGSNNILYSKPLLKKTVTKDLDANNSNNINIINLRNNIELKNNINISHSHNLINVNTNLTKGYNNHNQKSIFDNLNIKDESKPILFDQFCNKYGEIIIKNVCTKDLKLHVFIKYIDIGNIYIKNKNNNGLNRKLIMEHTDSITLFNEIKITQYYENKSFINGNNNENDFDNINIERNPFYKYNSERHSRYGIKEHYNIAKDNRKNLSKILTKRDEEEEDQLEINNFSNEEKYKINEDIKNSIVYLINFLQNMYNDNKKLILFNFFKNLRKIKTNALLHNSIKTRGKQKIKKSVTNVQRNNNKKIIEINNFNNYKVLNSNRSQDIKIKNNNSKTVDKSSLNPKITRNKEKNYNLNKPKLNDEIFKSNFKTKNNKINNNEDIFYNKKHHYNTSFNKSNKKNNTINNCVVNENNNKNKKELFLGDSKEKKIIKDEKVENKEKNKNIDDKNNQKLKEMKLAKLGKIFKNLEQENNIISAIKEQFLEWSNNNNLELRKSGNKNSLKEEDNKKENKKYGIKTFDMKCMFNNPFYDDNNKMKNIYTENNLQEIIAKFTNKLIIFSLNTNKKKNYIKVNKIDKKKYGGEDEKEKKTKFN